MTKKQNNKDKKYLFQKKRVNFCKKLFENGLNAASYILLSLREYGELFIDALPNSYPAFQILKETFGFASKNKFKKKIIQINISRLVNEGLIIKDSKRKIILTEKGKAMIDYIYDRYAVLEKSWDGKIRMVIFDIPEKKKYLREWLRKELFLLQFKPLQKSVFIGKHPLPKSFYQDILQNGLFENIYIFTLEETDKKEQLLELLEQ